MERETLQMALIGYQKELDHISHKMGEIRRQLIGKETPVSVFQVLPAELRQKSKHRISAAARERISKAQKKRWAEYHAKHPKKVAA